MNKQRAFLGLLMPIQGELMGFILAMGVPAQDADDVLQNAIYVAFDKFALFEEGTNFRAWAYAIVKNEVRRLTKEKSRRSLALSEEAQNHITRLAEKQEEEPGTSRRALTVCLDRLQKRMKEIITMRYRENMDAQAIAAKMNRPVDSIYTTLHRIRKTLHECINRIEGLQGDAL